MEKPDLKYFRQLIVAEKITDRVLIEQSVTAVVCACVMVVGW